MLVVLSTLLGQTKVLSNPFQAAAVAWPTCSMDMLVSSTVKLEACLEAPNSLFNVIFFAVKTVA